MFLEVQYNCSSCVGHLWSSGGDRNFISGCLVSGSTLTILLLCSGASIPGLARGVKRRRGGGRRSMRKWEGGARVSKAEVE